MDRWINIELIFGEGKKSVELLALWLEHTTFSEWLRRAWDQSEGLRQTLNPRYGSSRRNKLKPRGYNTV